MAYTKINWTEQTPLNTANLNHMETQYDEAVADFGDVMADPSLELVVPSVTSDPAGENGLIIYNSADNRFKYYNGSTWVNMALPGEVGI